MECVLSALGVLFTVTRTQKPVPKCSFVDDIMVNTHSSSKMLVQIVAVFAFDLIYILHISYPNTKHTLSVSLTYQPDFRIIKIQKFKKKIEAAAAAAAKTPIPQSLPPFGIHIPNAYLF